MCRGVDVQSDRLHAASLRVQNAVTAVGLLAYCYQEITLPGTQDAERIPSIPDQVNTCVGNVAAASPPFYFD